MADRVELQAEIAAPRRAVWPLVSSADGLRQWLDEAELDARAGGTLRLRLRDGLVEGKVLALDPPQHISFTFDWAAQPLGQLSVVAFDVIDHGGRSHLTIRHVGLPKPKVELHSALWRYWLDRLVDAARGLPAGGE